MQKEPEELERDHKKIGQEQELFLVSQEVGSGFPIFMPKGLVLRRQIENYITEEKEKRGFTFVWSPHLGKVDLYKKSGHWQKYDAMFPPIQLDKEEYVLKPMNCPHHFQIFLDRPRTYKELPMRLAENATVYRYEKSGEVNGLLRVRSLTQDDAHHFLRDSQIASEIELTLELIENIFKTFGFNDYRARISVRDSKDHSKYLGKDENWDRAEKALVDAVKKLDMKYEIGEGEAAFYGPKIDMMVKDSLGREWQLATCQLDFNQSENFDMSYINEKGEKERPAILHTAFFGSIERFMGILIEDVAGKFPTWLAPVQVKVIPISEKNLEYANEVGKSLKVEKIRLEIDERNEPLGGKVRDAELLKIPYILVVGDKESEAKTVSVRKRGSKESIVQSNDEFIKSIKNQIEEKIID